MSRLNRLLLALVVCSTIVAGATAPGLATPWDEFGGGDANDGVNADATVERAPDRATVTVAAVGRGETAEAARNNLSGDAEAITAALEDEGANVTSSRFQIRPEYEESREGREQVGYVAIHTVEAETSDVETAGTLIDAAVDAGADRVEGVRYSLSEETQQAAREEALTTAMNNARTDAEVVAATEGRSVGDAVTVQTSDHGRPVVYEAAAYAGDAGGRTNIQPGEVTVDASVSVTYELE